MQPKFGVLGLVMLIGSSLFVATSATAGVPRVVIAEEFGHDL